MYVRACLSTFLLIFLLITPQKVFCATAPLRYQGTHILTYATMPRLAAAFTAQSGINITIKGGGCADGVVVVVNDRFEMGGLCCPLKPSEVEQFGLVAHPVARDIKAVIVNRQNPLLNLSRDQLTRIHQGAISNWRDLGWVDRPIAVIFRKHCLDRREPVRTFLGLDKDLSNLAGKAIKVRTDKEIIDYVSRFPTAIGITSKVFVRGKGVKSLAIDSAQPTAANVAAGRYTFTATLYIITKGKADRRSRLFLDFVLGKQGQNIIEENLAGVK